MLTVEEKSVRRMVFYATITQNNYNEFTYINFCFRQFVTHVDWAAKRYGLQQFDIPKNILDLIYNEILVW